MVIKKYFVSLPKNNNKNHNKMTQLNNKTFIIPNKNIMEFEKFLTEFNLLQNVTDVNQRDFYTDYIFNDLTEEEIGWIEDEKESVIQAAKIG